jgi:hypothetical protein
MLLTGYWRPLSGRPKRAHKVPVGFREALQRPPVQRRDAPTLLIGERSSPVDAAVQDPIVRLAWILAWRFLRKLRVSNAHW